MTLKEAESICTAYGSFFANLNETKDYDKIHVFSSFDLPWSPAKLKYAFLIYAEDMYKRGEIDKHFEKLRVMYGSIDGTFKEDSEEINSELERISNIKDPEKQKSEELKFEAKFGIEAAVPDDGSKGEVEFNNFIADLSGNYSKG